MNYQSYLENKSFTFNVQNIYNKNIKKTVMCKFLCINERLKVVKIYTM